MQRKPSFLNLPDVDAIVDFGLSYVKLDKASLPPVRGGEGVLLLLERRKLGDPGAWYHTVFAHRGIAFSFGPFLAYVLYCVIVVYYCMTNFVTSKTNLNTLTGYVENEYSGLWIMTMESMGSAGFAMFLLLSFRVNSSYDRWWEGRKLWGSMINRTRDFSRQVVGYIGPHDPKLASRMVSFIACFAICFKYHLRGEKDMPELVDILGEEETKKCAAAIHSPNYILQRITTMLAEALRRDYIGRPNMIMMDGNLTEYEDIAGACERILKTPMPFAYVVHMRRFMLIWLGALPFSLVKNAWWGTIPVCAVIAYAIIGFEAIGVEIESPFGHGATLCIVFDFSKRLGQHSFTDVPASSSSAQISTTCLSIPYATISKCTWKRFAVGSIPVLGRSKTIL